MMMDLIAHKSDSEDPHLPIPKCSVIANCTLLTDVVLVSSDGHRFGAHCKNLGEFTGGFPLDIAPASGEEVKMPDLDSDALTLFLQYVHHHRQPDLRKVTFRTLNELAEAVEKYDVYSATEICRVHMARYAGDYCVEVFTYAARHGYRELMDEAGFIAIQNRYFSSQITVSLDSRPDIRAAWYLYKEKWHNFFSDCYNEPPPLLHRGGIADCPFWRKFRNVVVSQVRRETGIFSTFKIIVESAKYHLKDCRHCVKRADDWVGRVQGRGMWEDIPHFTSFLC